MPQSQQQQEHSLDRARKVYSAICEAARLKQPCPNNRLLGQRFGCSHGAIDNAINFLEAAGMVEKTSSPPRRFFIPKDGRETA